MNPESAPIELQPILTRFGNDVTLLIQSLQNGMITSEAWYTEMRRLLARYHIQAMQIGTGLQQLPEGAIDLLQKSLDFQDEYLDNFRMVIQATPDFNPAWVARALMYVGSIKVPYWEGRIYQEVGRFLPLPAMPAQGTQCMNNCGCTWEVRTLDADNGDYDAFWRRNLDDSCQTCIERESMWNPVQIRGGMLKI